MSRILVVDDDASILAGFRELLGARGHEVLTAADGQVAVECVERDRPELVVMDVWMPGLDGLAALRAVRERHPFLPVIVMTGRSTATLAIEASKLGAFDYRIKPFEPSDMLRLVDSALAAACGPQSVAAPAEVPPEPIVGQSPVMQEVYRAVGRVAESELPVLVCGEPGTGKELVARAIHAHSRRGGGPLVVVDCRIVPARALECEIFGCEAGAAEGAGGRRTGRLARAEGGTVLLRDVDAVPLELQGKLLAAVCRRGFERLGGDETVSADVRYLASTTRSLEGAVTDGRFREDLRRALSVLSIRVPPLRERPDDIPRLVRNLVSRYALELGVTEPALADDAWDLLRTHPWPGNIRELEDVLARALAFGRGHTIREEDIRRALQPEFENATPAVAAARSADLLADLVESFLSAHAGAHALASCLEETERTLLVEALRRAHGNQTRAAAILGIPRPTLHAKLQKYGISLQSEFAEHREP